MTVAAALLVLASAAPQDGADAAARVRALLERVGGDEDAVVVEHLTRLARERPDVLLDRLEERPAVVDPESGRIVERAWSLPEPERAAVLAGLEGLGRRPVVGALPGWLDAGGPQRATVALRVLARVGASQDLPLVADVVGRLEASARPSALQAELTAAVGAIAARDTAAGPAVRALVPGAEPPWDEALVRGLRSLPADRLAVELVECLGLRPGLDRCVLQELDRAADRLPVPADELFVARVRRFLWSSDPATAADAARLLGAVEDYGTAPDLIAALAQEGPAAEAAEDGLTRLAGRPLRGPEAWQAWLAEERGWYESRYPELRGRMRHAHVPTAVAALGELAGRRWRRHEIALEVATLLEHPRPELRRAACDALRRNGSRSALRPLVRALEDEDDGVATAAWTGLRAITGRDLPAEAEAWSALALPGT